MRQGHAIIFRFVAGEYDDVADLFRGKRAGFPRPISILPHRCDVRVQGPGFFRFVVITVHCDPRPTIPPWCERIPVPPRLARNGLIAQAFGRQQDDGGSLLYMLRRMRPFFESFQDVPDFFT